MYTGMYTGMCTDMFTDMYTGIFADICTGMFAGMFTEMYTGMFTDIFTDMFTDAWTDMCRRLSVREDAAILRAPSDYFWRRLVLAKRWAGFYLLRDATELLCTDELELVAAARISVVEPVRTVALRVVLRVGRSHDHVELAV